MTRMCCHRYHRGNDYPPEWCPSDSLPGRDFCVDHLCDEDDGPTAGSDEAYEWWREGKSGDRG